MNVLLISVKSEHPNGGIAVWTDYFLSLCEKHRIQCQLVNTRRETGNNAIGRCRPFQELVRNHRIFAQLRRQLVQSDIDAAYLNTSCGPFGLFRDARIARMIRRKDIPLITHYHCEIPYWVKRPASIRCLGRLARSGTANLVLCETSRDFLLDHYGIESRKVPNFVDDSILLNEEKSISDTIRTIFFTGRVCESKGAAEIFDVARRLPDIRFVCAGNVSSMVSSWDKPDNLCLLGHIPQRDIIAHLDRADVFFFPSHTEGSSIALIESMARGVPAVATDVGDNADTLGDCGIVVASGDTDAMVEAIARLQDPCLRRDLSRQAVERVQNNYTVRNFDDIFVLLRKLS